MRPTISRSISRRSTPPVRARRVWRVAHLSDVHVVGERYGFRIESGRAGPCGNGRLVRTMERLAALHASEPLDLVLISGDMTDAGISAEWAEFLEIVEAYPDLAQRTLILPGNHDVNIVDRANPARLDLPFSPVKTLRKMRALSAIAAVQGGRARVASFEGETRGPALAAALEPRRAALEAFADTGGLRPSARLARLWSDLFPLILPPEEEDGLGVALLNSNADTNFSFTNALGLITAGQAQRLTAALDAYPKARWIVASAPPPRRVSDARRGVLRAGRNRAHQWQLVSARLEALLRARRGYARPSPHRLDRLLREHQDRLGPLAGDGPARTSRRTSTSIR